jgi:hypothetical protein
MRLILLAALCITFTPSAFAGYGGGGMRMSGGSSGGSSSSSSHADAPPPIDRSGSIKARKDVNAVTAEVNKAQSEQNAIVGKLRVEFERTPDWKTAQAKLKSAQTEFDAARRASLDAMADRPAYRAARAARQQAEADREALRANPTASQDERVRVAKAAFDSAQALAKFESDAIAADPATKAAAAKVAEAKAAAAELLKTFEASCAQNADWQAAQKVIDEKKEALAAAQKTLADALTQEAQAERDRQKQIAASH